MEHFIEITELEYIFFIAIFLIGISAFHPDEEAKNEREYKRYKKKFGGK